MAENDFKYAMEDLYRIYLGARNSYRELLESDQVNTRFKVVIRQYLLPLVEENTTLESHLYYMTQGSREYEIYRQLGARVRLSRRMDRRGFSKGFSGRRNADYREEVQKIEELASLSPQEKERRGYILTELQIPKLKLAGFAW